MIKHIFAIAIAASLSACATPEVAQVRKSGDAELACTQLRTEYTRAQDLESAARKERTVTGTNVAAAIFFWPALLGTYANTESAINAAVERQRNLEKLATEKACKL